METLMQHHRNDNLHMMSQRSWRWRSWLWSGRLKWLLGLRAWSLFHRAICWSVAPGFSFGAQSTSSQKAARKHSVEGWCITLCSVFPSQFISLYCAGNFLTAKSHSSPWIPPSSHTHLFLKACSFLSFIIRRKQLLYNNIHFLQCVNTVLLSWLLRLAQVFLSSSNCLHVHLTLSLSCSCFILHVLWC